jgi:biopolymer transport protein ExbB/TolQ
VLLTLNQVLLIVLTVAAVVVVVFLILFLVQMRRTAREGERTLAEVRELAVSLKEIERKVNARIDDVGELLASSKQTAAGLAQASLFLTTRVVSPASRYWPLLYPLLRIGWKQLKKMKKRKEK